MSDGASRQILSFNSVFAAAIASHLLDGEAVILPTIRL